MEEGNPEHLAAFQGALAGMIKFPSVIEYPFDVVLLFTTCFKKK